MIELAYLLLFLIVLVQIGIHRNRSISPLIAIPLSIYILFWNAFPFLYSAIMRDRTNNIISYAPYQKVIVIQLLSVLFILILFSNLARLKLKPQRPPSSQQKSVNPKTILFLLVIALSFLLFLCIYSMNTIGMTYSAQVQYVVSESHMGNTFLSLLSALNIYIVPFSIACIFSGIDTLRNNKWIKWFSFTIIIVHTVYMTISGLRAFIIIPIILIALYWKTYPFNFKRKTRIILIVLVPVILIVIPFFSMSLRTIRAMESYNLQDFFDMFTSNLFSSTGDFILISLDDIYTKFSSLEHGAKLLDIEGMSRVGLSLITSSLTSPIPRMLYPAKPVPFSSNGEYSGVPYYLVPSLDRGFSQGNVVPVPPSTIAIWELGYLGLFLMIVCNVVNLLFINYFMNSELLLLRTIGFFMLTLPTFEFLISPTGLILKEALRIIVIVLFIKLLLLIVRPNRKGGPRLHNQTGSHSQGNNDK